MERTRREDKRQIATEYLDWLGLNPDLIHNMFMMDNDDPELSAYFGHPRTQAYILCERFLGIEATGGTILFDESA